MARGELGILKKKHVGVHKDLEEQKTGLHSMQVRHCLDAGAWNMLQKLYGGAWVWYLPRAALISSKHVSWWIVAGGAE